MITTVSALAQHQKTIRYEGGRKIKLDSAQNFRMISVVDTTYMVDSLGKIDTIYQKKFVPDTLVGTKQAIDSTLLADSTLSKNKKKNYEIEEQKKRLSFFRDTLPAGRVTLMSFIPGVGQAYNRQFWKVPVIYGAMGGFVMAGMNSNKKFNDYKSQWQQTIDLNLPQHIQDAARIKMNREGMNRTMFYSAAAAVYLYQVADATFNYRGPVNHIRKSTMLAAVFPGAGFFYTRTYWRLPIYYGGFALFATVIDYNSRQYRDFRNAYKAVTDGDPTTNVEARYARLSETDLANASKMSRRNRDLGILALAGAYVLSIIDTNVIATLKNWDMSQDLSLRIEPTIINNSTHFASSLPSGAGLSLKLRF